MPDMTVKIGGVNRYPVETSVEMTEGERVVWTIVFEKESWLPLVDQATELWIDGVRLFKGTVDTVDYTGWGDASAPRYSFVVTAVGLEQVADRFLVVAKFTNWTSGNIVGYLIGRYLANDGITQGVVAQGRTLSDYGVAYRSVADVIRDLADQNQFVWYIDENGALHFRERTDLRASFAVTLPARNISELRVKRTRQNVRTRQYVVGSMEGGKEREETFKGNTEKAVSTYYTRFPIGNSWEDPPFAYVIASNPDGTITEYINEVTEEGHGNGVWIYKQGEKWLRKSDGGFLPTNNKLVLQYQVGLPAITVVEDGPAINERITAGGGTGIYEAVEIDNSLDNIPQLEARANSLLNRFSRPAWTITFKTRQNGLRPGMLLPVAISPLGLSGDWMITTISGRGIRPHQWEWSVTAVSGELPGSWQAYFRSLNKKDIPAIETEDIRIVRSGVLWYLPSIDGYWRRVGYAANTARLGVARLGTMTLGTL